MSRGGPWRVLGIAATDDVQAIRRAYADKLRAMDVDRDAAGYAALRQARDTALYLARENAAGPRGEPEALEEEHPVPGGSEQTVAAEFDDQPLPDPERTAGPDVELTQVLFPGGEYSEVPLTDEEWALADAALGRIVGDVHGGELVRQHAADMWVADCLARAWPRSSMLLERAAAAFDWEKERGQIHEGRAQAFLNSRLRGMRFQAELEKPGHWGHNAWKELSRPGTKGLFGRFRANAHEVRTLLSSIRENFPELESYLHQEKVQSWDQPVGSPWFGTWSIIFFVFVALQLVAMCGRIVDEEWGDASPQPIEISANGAPGSEQQRRELVEKIFGTAATFEQVKALSPVLGQAIEANRGGGKDAELLARRWMFTAASKADWEHVVRIQQLKLELALLARGQGGTKACSAVLETGELPDDVTLPRELELQSQVLGKELLEAGLFKEIPQREPKRQATVPGHIFAAAQKASGVTSEVAEQVARGGGNPDERCLFDTALMAEVLRQPGRVDTELLRIL